MNTKKATPQTKTWNARGDPKPATIRAKHMMSRDVMTVGPETSIHDIALLLSTHHFGAVPVMESGGLVGIVSRGDLLRREELGSEPGYCSDDPAGTAYVKSRGHCARDVMAPDIVAVGEEATLAEIAGVMVTTGLRRLPVLQSGKLVGIVSRSDLVRALVSRPEDGHRPMTSDDDVIRYRVIETLTEIPGASSWLTSVRVSNGVVRLGGSVEDENALEPSRRAIREIPCVAAVEDHRSVLQPY